MYCSKCGKQIPKESKFCTRCGTQIEKMNSGSVCITKTATERDCFQQRLAYEKNPIPAATKKAERKKLKWWHILEISIGVLYMLSGIIVLFTNMTNHNDLNFSNDKKHNIEDYKYVKDNYYYCFPKIGGNQKYILKFSNLTETSITIEEFGYDLGLYGKNDFSHNITTTKMYYSDSENCYKFEFCGHWKIFRGGVMYDRQMGGEPQNFEYETARPIDPGEYWWFEKARQEPVQ